jgi:hypothetical protein
VRKPPPFAKGKLAHLALNEVVIALPVRGHFRSEPRSAARCCLRRPATGAQDLVQVSHEKRGGFP